LTVDLGLVNELSIASWAENGTTVAGQANGTAGSGANYLYWNRGISITSDDMLYIADRVNNRIVYVNLVGIPIVHIFGGYGSNIDQFNYPSDIAVTNTAVYVLDVNNVRVQKWSRNGTNPITMPGDETFDSGYNLYVDSDNNLYVSIYSDHQVVCFAPNSPDWTIVAGIGIAGTSGNQLNNPNGLFVDDAFTMYIADTGNNRIQKWTYEASTGITVAGNSSGLSGSSLTLLWSPESLVVDTDGYMYIVDRGNNRIIRWPPNATSGVCIAACTGNTGTEANQLYYPIDVAFDTNGSLYVSDDGNSRVQKYQILDVISK
jgi:sugar lactone lactonase YvrE